MKVVITDANIFMHLIDSGLPESFFRLDFEIATTEEVFAEIGDERHLLAPFAGGRLEIISSQDDQLATIQSAAFAPGLSFPDRTVLFHATLRNGTVLTGESLMRKECERLGLDVHGILWVLDRMETEGTCNRSTLAEKLTYLMSLPDFRVPKGECEARLKKWKLSN